MQVAASSLREELNFPNFPEFRQRGIDLSRVDARVVQALQVWRDLCGKPIALTPVPEGIFRTEGSPTSQHFAVGRLSTALDVFPADPREAYLHALDVEAFRGIGLYLDTRPSQMMHVDVRSGKRILWVRDKGTYVYMHKEPERFMSLLGRFFNGP